MVTALNMPPQLLQRWGHNHATVFLLCLFSKYARSNAVEAAREYTSCVTTQDGNTNGVYIAPSASNMTNITEPGSEY